MPVLALSGGEAKGGDRVMVLRWGFRILLTATLLVVGYIALFDPPPPVEVPRLLRTVGRFEPDCARSEFVDLILSGQHFRFARHDLGWAVPVAGRKDDVLYQEQVRFLCDPGGGLPVSAISMLPKTTYDIAESDVANNFAIERDLLIDFSSHDHLNSSNIFNTEEMMKIHFYNKEHVYTKYHCTNTYCYGIK